MPLRRLVVSPRCDLRYYADGRILAQEDKIRDGDRHHRRKRDQGVRVVLCDQSTLPDQLPCYLP